MLAAALYGTSDFLGGIATRRSAIFGVAIVSQGVGLLLLLAFWHWLPGRPAQQDMLFGVLAGIGGGLGIALLYHALSIGKMGVVSPITAVLAASLPVAVGLRLGEGVSRLQLVGMGVALLAVVLISASHEDDGSREISTAGVKEAIASGIALGCFFVFLGAAHGSAGMWPLVAARASSLGVLTVLALAARKPVALRRDAIALVAVAGAIDMSANGLFVLAAHLGGLSIAAVLTSLYPASTVFLAAFLLRERLRSWQWLGVALALLGVACIAA
ncbi:MAG: EamA family transporter [Vulcanimicrobiaceae bacterium]